MRVLFVNDLCLKQLFSYKSQNCDFSYYIITYTFICWIFYIKKVLFLISLGYLATLRYSFYRKNKIKDYSFFL